MPSCRLPPGREYEILHCLPVVPPGLADDFLATGHWPPGIQAGLERTKNCPWAVEMAQYRLSAVVVRGVVVQLPVPVLGLLPAGWYREFVEGGVVVEVDPESTLVMFREAAARAPLGSRVPVAVGSVACPIPVPTVDFLMPYPFSDLWMDIRGTSTFVRAGALGALLWRLWGSAHPLFGTGSVGSYVDPRFLSDLGLAWLSTRAVPVNAGMPGVLLVGAFDNWYVGAPLRPANVLRHYQASHMQCLPRLHTPAGEPIPWRWHLGGSKPAARLPSQEADYLELKPPGALFFRPAAWPSIRPYLFDADGNSYLDATQEAPFGTRTEFSGPAPGTFLVPS